MGNEYRIYLEADKNVLGEVSGIGYIRLRKYLMPLDCTLKHGQNGKFYMISILPWLKIKRKGMIV